MKFTGYLPAITILLFGFATLTAKADFVSTCVEAKTRKPVAEIDVKRTDRMTTAPYSDLGTMSITFSDGTKISDKYVSQHHSFFGSILSGQKYVYIHSMQVEVDEVIVNVALGEKVENSNRIKILCHVSKQVIDVRWLHQMMPLTCKEYPQHPNCVDFKTLYFPVP